MCRENYNPEFYPVIGSNFRRNQHLPKNVPFKILKSHGEQAMKNHSQTLERLQERGGLSVAEIYFIMNDLNWWEQRPFPTDEECMIAIEKRIKENE